MTPWNPQDYSEQSAEQQKWARELIGKLGLRGDERVLDVGCGDGKVTLELARSALRGSVLGIDTSAEMIEFARRTHSGQRNLRFEMGDAARLSFDGEFDVVFSTAVLHWIKDHRPVLQGIGRALKKGGRVLLQMGGAGNAAAVVAAMDDLMAQQRWREFFRDFEFPYGFHEPTQYRQWMQEAGLKPIRVELIPKDMVHQGKAGLAGWLRTTWMPYTQRVPNNLREQFIADVVERYVSTHPADSEGNVHLNMVRLEVEGRRGRG